MEFVVTPVGKQPVAYTWRHGSEAAAKREAEKIASDMNCPVIVSRVIGTFKPRIDWVAEK